MALTLSGVLPRISSLLLNSHCDGASATVLARKRVDNFVRFIRYIRYISYLSYLSYIRYIRCIRCIRFIRFIRYIPRSTER